MLTIASIDPALINKALVNSGYFMQLIALLTKDILWLRAILIVAQSVVCAYAYRIGVMPIFFWNIAFVTINIVRLAGILNERRPIKLPSAEEDVYRLAFAAMTRREFLYLWEMGHTQEHDNQQLIHEGEKQKDLVLLLDGCVSVQRAGQHLARLGRGTFIAEMSFVSGDPASADVMADGRVRTRAWSQEKLFALEQLNPSLLIKLQNILARDLSSKVKAANQALKPGRD